MPNNDAFYHLPAPTSVTATVLTTESIQVRITPSSDPTGVDHYVTTTREDPGITCRGQQCALIHLEHAKMYTVVSRACLAEANGCSVSVENATWTKPTRTVLTL